MEERTGDTEEEFEVGDFEFESTRLGAEVVLGVQWQPVSGLDLGVVLISPRLAFYDFAERSDLKVFGKLPADAGERPFSFDYHEEESDDPGVGLITAGGARVGVAVAVGRGWVSAEGDYHPAFENAEHKVNLEALWNARLGFRQKSSETLSFGAGLFTDRSQHREPVHLSEFRVHYYGVAGGIELRTPLRLHSEKQADSLVFVTTLGLRYALGLGRAAVERVDLDASMDEEPLVDVTFHEVGFHLGSALYF